jgi:MFS family permease
LLSVKTNEQLIKKLSSPLEHLKEGFVFVWQNTPIRALLLIVGTFSFWGMSFSTLMPIFSDQILRAGPQGLGILMASSGVGAVIGGLFLASRKKVIGVKKIIGFCSILFSTCLFVFAYSKSFILSLILLMIIGFAFMIINAGSNTAMQVMSPDYLRGRGVGFYSTMFLGMFPLGSLTIGCLAYNFSPQMAVSIGALVCFVVGLYFLISVPKLTKEAKLLLEVKQEAEVVLEKLS